MLTSSCLFLNSFSIICKWFYITLFFLISHQNVISSGQIIMAGLFIILSQNLIHILEHSWCSTNTALQKRKRVVEHRESIAKSFSPWPISLQSQKKAMKIGIAESFWHSQLPVLHLLSHELNQGLAAASFDIWQCCGEGTATFHPSLQYCQSNSS